MRARTASASPASAAAISARLEPSRSARQALQEANGALVQTDARPLVPSNFRDVDEIMSAEAAKNAAKD